MKKNYLFFFLSKGYRETHYIRTFLKYFLVDFHVNHVYLYSVFHLALFSHKQEVNMDWIQGETPSMLAREPWSITLDNRFKKIIYRTRLINHPYVYV